MGSGLCKFENKSFDFNHAFGRGNAMVFFSHTQKGMMTIKVQKGDIVMSIYNSIYSSKTTAVFDEKERIVRIFVSKPTKCDPVREFDHSYHSSVQEIKEFAINRSKYDGFTIEMK